MKVVEITYRYAGSDATARPRPADAEGARERLDQGSRAMSALLDASSGDGVTARRIIAVDARDLGLQPGAKRAPEQRPYAAVLGCSDARVPIELIFNEGPNDLFVIRVAGNGLGAEVLGSLSYAVDHLGRSLKLVVILGHSGCGAVSAAVDVVLNPRSYLALAERHALRGILDRLLVVVYSAAKKMIAVHGPDATGRPGYRAALIEAAIVLNAALAAYTVQQELGAERQGLRAAYGVYLLAEHSIWAPRVGTSDAQDSRIHHRTMRPLANLPMRSRGPRVSCRCSTERRARRDRASRRRRGPRHAAAPDRVGDHGERRHDDVGEHRRRNRGL